MDESLVAFGSLDFITRHCSLYTVNSFSPLLYIDCRVSCALTIQEQSVVYRSLAAIYLCSVQFVPCFASADNCSLHITFNIIVYMSPWNFYTRRFYGTHWVFVCVCLHNSQTCVIVVPFVIVRCTHCNASRVVFLMWPLHMHCRLLLCSSCGMRWGGGFGLIALKWGFFINGLVLARLSISHFGIEHIRHLGGCFSIFRINVVSLNCIDVCAFVVTFFFSRRNCHYTKPTHQLPKKQKPLRRQSPTK